MKRKFGVCHGSMEKGVFELGITLWIDQEDIALIFMLGKVQFAIGFFPLNSGRY